MIIFPTKYKCLNQNEFELGEYKIIPIRYLDRIEIMKWRNEQLYHLRQIKPLTKESQNRYFNEVIANLFEQDKPSQILFSYFKNEVFLAYGGLVHINWLDRNAEVSFVMKTEEEQNNFERYWGNYLELIERVAFKELKIHKLFVYAFDLRPHLYQAIEKKGYKKEATLKDHCFFEGNYIDVVIHSKINDI